MKYSLLISALLTAASTGYAQNDCSKNHAIFRFDQGGRATAIHTLGSNPEFPFIKNLSTPQEVLVAMKRENSTHSVRSVEMNKMLRQIGFENGIEDLELSSIQAANLPSGTTGNMGDGNYNSSYTKLTGNPQGFKAWKVTSDKGCSMYFLAKCGNAFAAGKMSTGNRTACREMPVSITSETKVISTGTDAAKRVAEKKTYIYYREKDELEPDEKYARRDIPSDNPSRPLLLRSVRKAQFVPQEYKVTVSPQDEKVRVCPNKTVDVAANINVEYSSEYTGNYSNSTNKVYKEVSKRVYMKSMRKMRKADRKADKVTAMTDVRVNR